MARRFVRWFAQTIIGGLIRPGAPDIRNRWTSGWLAQVISGGRLAHVICEVDWPALRRFPNSFYRLLNGAFKVNRCNQAAVAIPGQRGQIFLLRLRMKSKRLTCHAAVYVPSAEPLPMGSFRPCRIAPHPGAAPPPAARPRQHPDR